MKLFYATAFEVSIGTQTTEVGTRALAILNAIDKTLGVLGGTCELLKGVEQMANGLATKLSSVELKAHPDPEGKAVEIFERTRAVTAGLVESFNRRRDSALSDPALTSEDGVVEAFDDAIECGVAAYEAIGALIDVIQIQSARLEKRHGPFKTADEVMAALFA